MVSLKQLKARGKTATRQRQVVLDLNVLANDIERCERTIADIQQQLEDVNSRYQGPRTTREDIAYLSALLECARKKLAWEKQVASVQKRTPSLLEQMSSVLQDPQAPPAEQTRADILEALRNLQSSLERLQRAKN